MFKRLKKIFSKKETIVKDFQRFEDLNKLGISEVAIDKDTEMYLTPHNLMFLAYMITELHPEIMSSYIQWVNFFVGKGIRSADPDIDKHLEKNMKFKIEVKKAVMNYNVTGNVYAQKFYEEIDVNNTIIKRNKLKGWTILRDSSRVAYNFDAPGDSKYWVYTLNYTGSKKAGGKMPVSFTFIKYAIDQISNMVGNRYVVELPKNQILHLKSPYGRNEYYGHSTLMSGWGYARSLKEIIDNLFRISKYQAIGKKIIQVGNLEQPVSDIEMQELEYKFFAEEKQAIFINKEVRVSSLTYAGEYNTMQSELDYIRKALMSGSVPTFLTAFAADFNNRSLGDDSLIGFFMNLESDRELMLNFFNDLICETYHITSGDAQLYFDGVKTYEEIYSLTRGENEDAGGPEMSTTVTTPDGSDTTIEPIPGVPEVPEETGSGGL